METCMIISLYILQTFIGAVLWRKYGDKEGFWRIENGCWALFASSFVISNIIGLFILSGRFIDFLASKKKQLYRRLEIINHTSTGKGRDYIKKGNLEIEFSVQDSGETLKIFITDGESDTTSRK